MITAVPALYSRPARVLVCCSRILAMRPSPSPAAGIRRFVTVRKMRIRIRAIAKIVASRRLCSSQKSVDLSRLEGMMFDSIIASECVARCPRSTDQVYTQGRGITGRKFADKLVFLEQPMHTRRNRRTWIAGLMVISILALSGVLIAQSQEHNSADVPVAKGDAGP